MNGGVPIGVIYGKNNNLCPSYDHIIKDSDRLVAFAEDMDSCVLSSNNVEYVYIKKDIKTCHFRR